MFKFGERQQALDVVCRDRLAAGHGGDAGIARRDDDIGHPRALFQAPGQGMFATAAADN